MVSNSVLLSGYEISTSIQVSGGEYSINGGTFTSSAGNLPVGASLRLRLNSSGSFNTKTSATVTVGGIPATFDVTTRAGDATPSAFVFNAVPAAERSTLTTSNAVTLSGFEISTPISVSTGAAYSINGATFISTPSTVAPGASVRIQLTSSPNFTQKLTGTLTVGGVTGSFDVTTRAGDATPAAFAFNAVPAAERSTLTTSNAVTLSGFEISTPISVSTGAAYSINGGTFISAPSTVAPGASVRIQLTSSPNFTEKLTGTLTVGGVPGSFDVTTRAGDATPAAFAFNAVPAAERSTLTTSNAVTLSGFEISTPISVSTGAAYSINGGTFISAPSTVAPGASVRIQLTSSPNFTEKLTGTLTVGGVPGSFDVTTRAGDATPAAFAFNAVPAAERSTLTTSNAVTLSGFEISTPISVSTGAAYSINGGTFISTPSTVAPGASVRIQLTSSPNFATKLTGTLTVGGLQGIFDVTTRAGDATPAAFAFNAVPAAERSALTTSNAVTLSGFEISTPISVSTGAAYSINGGTFISTPSTVAPGASVRIQLTSSPNFATKLTGTLTVGGLQGIFDVTTRAGDATPAAFAFNAVPAAERSTLTTSNAVTLSGFEISTPISVSTGAAYSINGGTFISTPSTVAPGASVRIQLTSSPNFATKLTGTLTVGGLQGIFDVTTRAGDATPAAFAFNAVPAAERSTLTTSNAVTLSGFEISTPISVSTGAAYSINGGTFISTPSTVAPGASVRIQLTSSPNFATKLTGTLTVGGVPGSFDVTTRAGDATPAAFAFNAVPAAERSTLTTSNAVTLSGFEISTPISVSTGAAYSINGGTFISTPSTVAPGASVRIQLTSSPNFATKLTGTLTVGGLQGIFDVTTRAGDATPAAFAFNAVPAAERSTLTTSNAVTLSGFEISTPISVSTGAAYSINGGTFISTPSTVAPGASVRIQLTSSPNFATKLTGTLTVGGIPGSLDVTTRAASSTPNAFSFSAVPAAERSTLRTSNAASLTGLEVAAPISVSAGAAYSINGGTFISTPSTVAPGSSVRVQIGSSSAFSTKVTAILNVGGVTGLFDVTTRAPITLPNNFSFTGALDVEPNTVVTSSTTLSGYEVPIPISVTGAEYSINGGSFQTADSMVPVNATITLRLRASPLFSTTVTANVNVGGFVRSSSVTTRAVRATPSNFSFPAVLSAPRSTLISSNTVLLSGYEVAIPISINGGEYSINGGSFTSSAGTVPVGATLRLRLSSSPNFSTKVTATVLVGGLSRNFDVTTVSSAPGSLFSFDGRSGPISTFVESVPASISGYGSSVAISVSGSQIEYRVNNGPWQATPSNVDNTAAFYLQLRAMAPLL